MKSLSKSEPLKIHRKRGFMMNNEQSLSHTKWECKYHLTWIPKYRKKTLYGDLRKYLGEVLRDLAQRRECEILEGHLMPDHAHMLISIPPNVSSKGKVRSTWQGNTSDIRRILRVNIFGPEDTMCQQ
jgi:putative transposase